jgi:long-chain acyl-CoA synthetase
MRKDRLFDFLDFQLKEFPLDRCIGSKINNEWVFYSTREIVDTASKLACGLLQANYKKGDKIALVSYKNRPEWTILDIATQMVGIVNVPVYPSISPSDYEYIFNESEIKAVFVGDGDLFAKVSEAKLRVPSLSEIYCFDQSSDGIYWESLFSEKGLDKLDQIKEEINSDDLATIIYTSGTTGKPKGVMLSHNNMSSIVRNTEHVLPPLKGKPVLSFLPLCHIFERTVSFAYLHKSASIYFTGTNNLGGEAGDLNDVKPHFFTCVPRLLEKVYEKIYNKGLALTGLKRKLFFWALALTDDFEYDKEYSGLAKIQRNIADKLIFSKWREALGGNVEGIVSGAAPLSVKMARVFSAAGIPIYEGYGLTEAAPTITLNLLDKNLSKIGTVGPVIPEVDVIIDDSEGDYKPGEGEILAHGPNIMLGYYKKPEETKKVFKKIDGKRYLRTGDVGKFVTNNTGTKFLKITDRKKELMKTSGGKYVAPAPIENKYKEDFLIEQIMVVGDQRKFVSALIVPSEPALKDWCKKKDIKWTGLTDMIKHQDVIQRYQTCCDRFNPLFGHIEQIKKFQLLDQPWEAEKKDGTEAELTPTQKLKRRVILKKFIQEIESIYKD